MASFDDPAFFGDRWAQSYGNDRPDPSLAVEFLAGLAGTRRVLELASGAGRVTIPLAAKGVSVEGVEGSEAMAARMRDFPGGARIPVRIGDLADVPARGPFGLIYLVFNTLFNLPDAGRQQHCFHEVARALEPDGAFVLECFVPEPSTYDGVKTLSVTEDSATISVTKHDAAAQRYAKQTITFSESGIKLLPVALRYCWPSELDLMAAAAGLRLDARYADWERRPFDSTSTSHVSVYRPMPPSVFLPR